MKRFVSVGSVLLAASITGGAPAQVLYTLVSPNEEPSGRFGHAVSGAGDVSNDGCADVIVGAYYENPGTSPTNAGRAYVFSGATGDTLYALVSPNEEVVGNFGCSVSGAGDVNSDGYADVVVGAEGEDPGSSPDGAGRAYIFDGATGALLHTLVSPNEETTGRFGHAVSGAGDVNNDGYADVIVGAPSEDPGASPLSAGRAYVFNGYTATLIYALASFNEEAAGSFGHSVSGAGDVNNDGHADIVVGAHAEDPGTSPWNAGRAYLFSGQTGGLLYTLVSPNEQDSGFFGWSVSGAGDANNDGYADVIVGAYTESPGASPNAAGRAYVFSGTTGAALMTLVSPNEETGGWFGYSVSGAGDVNNDRCADVVVGTYKEDPGTSPDNAGRAHVFSGATGAPLYTLVSPNEEYGGFFGSSVSGAGDVNSVGYADLIVGAHLEDPGTSPVNAGRAYVFAFPYVVLSGGVSGGQLVLQWTACSGAVAYWVYGADNEGYFEPGFAAGYEYRVAVLSPLFQTWSSLNGIGDPGHNWTYLVIPVDASEQELCRSNRLGEHDFSLW